MTPRLPFDELQRWAALYLYLQLQLYLLRSKPVQLCPRNQR